MSDWTYEMLRYAFSWNDESSEKALKYVVTGRSPSESMSEFQTLGFEWDEVSQSGEGVCFEPRYMAHFETGIVGCSVQN